MKIVVTRDEMRNLVSLEEVSDRVNTEVFARILNTEFTPSGIFKTFLVKRGIVYSNKIVEIRISISGDFIIEINSEFIADVSKAYGETIIAVIPSIVKLIEASIELQDAIRITSERKFENLIAKYS